jgi:hypothetical protein
MDDTYVGALILLLIIIANFVVGLVQKAKAEEQRRRRLAEKKSPEQAVRPTPARGEVRPQPPVPPERPVPVAPPVRELARPAQGPSRPQDLIREWAKRLEEALQPVEPPPEPPPKPVEVTTEPALPRPPTVRPHEPRRLGRRRPDVCPRGRSEPLRRTAFLGRLHPNPVVNGIILSEVFSRPVALREDTPNLPH